VKNLHYFKGHRDRTLRYFWIYRIGGVDRRKIELSLEISYPKKSDSFGFRFHIGNRSSETPIDGHIDLNRIAFYWSFSAPKIRRWCEWVGRGHKRDLSLKIHNGQLWWRLWYDDDNGYDDYHKCDSWRKPKLWPWSRGRKKYRPWMCLRDGNIHLNPLDAIYGPRLYKYEDLEVLTTVTNIGQWTGDEYEIKWKLQKQTRQRNFGPRWLRGFSDEGFTASWDSKEGIPFRNHDWKGDNVYGSAERVNPITGYWLKQAEASLRRRIKDDRERHNYRPKSAK
jgi:hypothetical protein